MENSEFCPIYDNCSVYRDKICHNQIVGLTYRMLYCQQTHYRYKICKRYQIFEKIGRMAPYYVLPNTGISVDEIIQDTGLEVDAGLTNK